MRQSIELREKRINKQRCRCRLQNGYRRKVIIHTHEASAGEERAEIAPRHSATTIFSGAGNMVIEQLHTVPSTPTGGNGAWRRSARQRQAKRQVDPVCAPHSQRWGRTVQGRAQRKSGKDLRRRSFKAAWRGDGAEKSAYAACLDGDTSKSPPRSGRRVERRAKFCRRSEYPRGDPDGTQASHSSREAETKQGT